MQTFDRANLGKSREPYGEPLDLGLRALAGLRFPDFFYGINLAHLNARVKNVEGRDKPGHDDSAGSLSPSS